MMEQVLRHRMVAICGGAVLALSGCMSSPPPVARGPIVLDGVEYVVTKRGMGGLDVARKGRPFENWEGQEARRAADRFCGGRAKTSIRDRFEGGTWVILEGCA